MHAISSYRGNRFTHKQTHKHTHTHTHTHKQTRRQDRLQYTAPQLALSVMTVLYELCMDKTRSDTNLCLEQLARDCVTVKPQEVLRRLEASRDFTIVKLTITGKLLIVCGKGNGCPPPLICPSSHG